MTTRLAALSRALDAGAGRFFDPSVREAREVLERAGARLELSMDHTVVALAGSTGSGKSSLFNAVCGMDLARVGVRRPTTSQPLACIWGNEGAKPLLDRLGVPTLNRVARESVLDPDATGEFDGLILLDLPDHDSTEHEHRLTVERLIKLVDLFVWVMDPQKYADAAVHERYLRPLSAHGEVTVVVLNHVDRLADADIEPCVADLRRLLDDDGLGAAPVLPVSAATGAGVDAFMTLLKRTVQGRRAGLDRVEADARRAAERMRDAAGAADAGDVSDSDRERLVIQLAEASRIEPLSKAAADAYLRRGKRRTPVPEPVDPAPATTAVKELGGTATGSVTGGWGGSIRAVADEAGSQIPEALDDALSGVDLDGGPGGRWWRLSAMAEWLALVTGTVGAGWALATGADSVPLTLLMVGAASAFVLAAARFLAARRARERRAVAVREQLRDLVANVADDVVVRPLRDELDRYRVFRQALDDAAG